MTEPNWKARMIKYFVCTTRKASNRHIEMVSSSQNSKIVRQLLTDKRLSIVTAAQLTVAYFKQQKHQQQDLGALEKLAVEKQKKQDRENLKQLQAYPDGRVCTDP